jgi:hypothetical protein
LRRALWAGDEEQLKSVCSGRSFIHLLHGTNMFNSMNFLMTSSPPWRRVISSRRPGRYRVLAMSVPSCSVPSCDLWESKPDWSAHYSLCPVSLEPLRCQSNERRRSSHREPKSTPQQWQGTRLHSQTYRPARPPLPPVDGLVTRTQPPIASRQ